MAKISKPIRRDKKTIGTILYNAGDPSILWVIKQIRDSFHELRTVFRRNIPHAHIELLYSRSEFNKSVGQKTPDWLVGLTSKNAVIRIVSPSVVSTVSAGTHNKLGMKKIIKHEICHLFNHTVSQKPLRWANEGVALFLAGQKKRKISNQNEWERFFNACLKKNCDLKTFADVNGYGISYWIAQKMWSAFGQEKMIRILKLSPGRNFNKSLLRYFKINELEFKNYLLEIQNNL